MNFVVINLVFQCSKLFEKFSPVSGYSQHGLSVGVIYVGQNFKKQPDCESMACLPMPLICPFPLALCFPGLLDSDQILISTYWDLVVMED